MAEIRLVGVEKFFGRNHVIKNLNLHIEDGEFLTLLGPSGCGKTTTLRMIAGFENPTEGEIYIGDRKVYSSKDGTNVPPEERNIGMVFQNYAVWPHMTVFENVAYPLKIRKIPKEKIRDMVEEILKVVKLEGLQDRYPYQLSGGQQQRVAFARALVYSPSILLLDEPLSNLDAKLREEMRFEIKELQRRVGITVVYVTHDQSEAMAMSDRIAVMKDGVIQQIGTPREIYEKPANSFVASFIGVSNFFKGRVVQDGVVELECGLKLEVEGEPKGSEVLVMVRPEDVVVGEGEVEAVVERVVFLGKNQVCFLRVYGASVRAEVPKDVECGEGSRVRVNFKRAVVVKG